MRVVLSVAATSGDATLSVRACGGATAATTVSACFATVVLVRMSCDWSGTPDDIERQPMKPTTAATATPLAINHPRLPLPFVASGAVVDGVAGICGDEIRLLSRVAHWMLVAGM